MARLRRNVRPDGLRQRMIDKYVDKYHPELGRARDPLMWVGHFAAVVGRLEAGVPVEFYAWQIPRDARAPFGINDRVRLIGDELELVVSHGR